MSRKYQVFISSTFEDLKNVREAVSWTILKTDNIPVGMEAFCASDDRGWKTIKKAIDESDYYILIVAGRYGSIDKTSGLSWTEKEYNYAHEKGIPILCFVRDPKFIQTESNKTPDIIDTGNYLKELNMFKEKLDQTHSREFWTTQEDLLAKVSTALNRAIRSDEEKRPRPGWFRGDNTSLLLKEIKKDSNLKKELIDAFDNAENLREDGIRLGVRRILASNDEVKKQSIEDIIGNAKTVYIFSTTANVTANFSTFLSSKPNTQFRFIFADIPEDSQLDKFLNIIHDVPARERAEASIKILDSKIRTLSNVMYKTIRFIPTFSAILAIGETEKGEEWGLLQTDHYLVRTPPDSHVWLVIEGPGSILFDRYRKLIEDIWQDPEKYDIENKIRKFAH